MKKLLLLVLPAFTVVFAVVWLMIASRTAVAPGISGKAQEQSLSTIQAPPSPTPAQCLERLPLSFLAGQVLMIGVPADAMVAQASIFKNYDIGGAAIMTSPVNPLDGSIKKFKADAASFGVPPLIATDEEGGIVQRFADLGVLPAPAQIASSMNPSQAQKLVSQHGSKLKAIGIDMILGPLADVAPSPDGGVLGSRVFSSDPTVVTAYDLAYIKGWQAPGLLPTLKHFPGLGSATANTDYAIATTPPLSYLAQHDFVPYRALNTTGTAVMVGNQNVPGWFSGPATLSPVSDKYLRQTLGYRNNLVITDSLSAAAITKVKTEPQAVDDAIIAGNDIALFVELPGSTLSDNQQIVTQAENLIENSVRGGSIPKQQLLMSVQRKLTAQHVSACTIKG